MHRMLRTDVMIFPGSLFSLRAILRNREIELGDKAKLIHFKSGLPAAC